MSITVRTTGKSYVYDEGDNVAVTESGVLTVFAAGSGPSAKRVAAFSAGNWVYAEKTGASESTADMSHT